MLASGLACSEWLHFQASRRDLPASPPVAAGRPVSEAIIVLGYPPTRSGGLRGVHRWRTRIAARSRTPGRSTTLIFTGGTSDARPSEARVMSRYALDALGVPGSQVRLEEQARSTWENVEFSLPLAEDADVIKIASDPLHAARARSYIMEQRPDLADRLAGSDDYRVFEHPLIKGVTAAYELLRRFR